MIDRTYLEMVDPGVDGETAVLLPGQDGEVVEHLDITSHREPVEARASGAVLEIEVDYDEFVTAA